MGNMISDNNTEPWTTIHRFWGLWFTVMPILYEYISHFTADTIFTILFVRVYNCIPTNELIVIVLWLSCYASIMLLAATHYAQNHDKIINWHSILCCLCDRWWEIIFNQTSLLISCDTPGTCTLLVSYNGH